MTLQSAKTKIFLGHTGSMLWLQSLHSSWTLHRIQGTPLFEPAGRIDPFRKARTPRVRGCTIQPGSLRKACELNWRACRWDTAHTLPHLLDCCTYLQGIRCSSWTKEGGRRRRSGRRHRGCMRCHESTCRASSEKSAQGWAKAMADQ